MRNASLLLCLFLFSSRFSYCEPPLTELESSLSRVAGQDRVDVLIKLSRGLMQVSPEKAGNYAQEALNESIKLGSPKNEGLSLKLIATSKRNLGQIDEAVTYYQRAVEKFRVIHDLVQMAPCLGNLGILHSRKSENEKALGYLEEANACFKELGNMKAVAAGYNNMGTIYCDMGEMDRALEYHYDALKIEESQGNTYGMANNLNSMGNVHSMLKDYSKALVHYRRAKKLFEEIGHRKRVAVCISNIGATYESMGKNEQALSQYQESYAIRKSEEDKKGMAIDLNNMGVVYRNMGQLGKALMHYEQSLAIDKELGDQRASALVLMNMGDIDTNQKNYESALQHFQEALKIAKRIKSRTLLEQCYKNLSALYYEQGNYKDAYTAFVHHAEIKDEIVNESSQNRIAELQEKYEADKRNEELVLLRKENELQHITLKQELFKKRVYVIGLILISLLAILLFARYRWLFAFWKKKNHVGPYLLKEKVGSGGMAVVYRAVQIKDRSSVVALKLLRSELTDLEQKQRFFNEARIIDCVEHKNIIRVYERGEHQDQLYIAMEFLEGTTLAHRIGQPDHMEADEYLPLFFQLLDALSALHSQHIIHRDLKPENVMLVSREGEAFLVKLLDFGLAKSQSLPTLTRTSMVMGTISYMAPEQLFHSVYSLAGDIYSMGIIFYEMVTKEKPFKGETTGEIMFEILNKVPSSPKALRPDLPDNVNQLILNMINKEPQKRPDAISLKREITAFLSEFLNVPK